MLNRWNFLKTGFYEGINLTLLGNSPWSPWDDYILGIERLVPTPLKGVMNLPPFLGTRILPIQCRT